MGKYIIFEGADGVGKSTMAKMLAYKQKAVYLAEPYNYSEATKRLRRNALSLEVNGLEREYLLMANRLLGFNEMLIPSLREGKSVVSDRSFLSGMVYARMEGFSFMEWQRISKLFFDLPEELMNPVIVFVTNKEFRPRDGEVDDRYDMKPTSFHEDVADTFLRLFTFLGISPLVLGVDFKESPDDNFTKLEKLLEGVL